MPRNIKRMVSTPRTTGGAKTLSTRPRPPWASEAMYYSPAATWRPRWSAYGRDATSHWRSRAELSRAGHEALEVPGDLGRSQLRFPLRDLEARYGSVLAVIKLSMAEQDAFIKEMMQNLLRIDAWRPPCPHPRRRPHLGMHPGP